MSRAVPILVICLLAATAFQVYRVRARLAARDADPAAVKRLSASLDAIPLQLGEGRYTGERYPLSKEVVEQSGSDVYLSNQYRSATGDLFRLYVGGSIANDENFHAPSYCMPAAGWEIVEESTTPFAAYPAGEARMRRLLLEHGGSRMVVYYWFQAGERLADHEWTVRYERLFDLLAGQPLRPTVIVAVYVPVGDDVEATERHALEFLRAVGPSLRQAITH